MEISQNGLSLIERFEGCVLHAYQDCVGVWTIGYGHTDGVYCGQTITQDEAQSFLQGDAQSAGDAVNQFVTVSLTQNQFDALVDFTFNLGSGSLEHSTLLTLLNQSNYSGAADQFTRWCYAGGQVNDGLLERRKAEQALFLQ